MHVYRVLSVLLLAVTIFVVPAQGQSAGDDTKIGAGVFFEAADSNVGVDGNVTVTVPILLPSIRLEPQIGYGLTSRSVTGEDDETDTILEIGGGVFKTLRTYDSASIYAGGRIGLVHRSQTTGNVTLSETGFFVGPAFGGEYNLGDHFSLGAEAGLFYRGIPTPEQEDLSLSTIRTNGRVFVRVYL
jgi:hypothetical protein